MTPFETIYKRFFANIDSFKLAKLDIIYLEENLNTWLQQGIGLYPNPTKDFYDIDTTTSSFNETLNNTEIEALAKYMVMAYLNTIMISDEYLYEVLNSKDYREFSKANKIDSIRELKKSINDEASTLVSRNSYNVSALKKYMDGNRS